MTSNLDETDLEKLEAMVGLRTGSDTTAKPDQNESHPGEGSHTHHDVSE